MNAARTITGRVGKLRSARRPGKHAPPPPQSRFDLFLVRSAYIAQVVAVLATILGFYFTVIPLYQKAAIDEQLAKRETELKETQQLVEAARQEAYQQRRINFTERFALRAAPCSGIKRAMAQPALGSDDVRQQLIGLDYGIASCLKDAINEDAVNTLAAGDLTLFTNFIGDLGGRLEAQQQAAKQRVAEVGSLARSNSSLLEPVGPAMQRKYALDAEIAAALRRPIPRQVIEQRFQYQVRITEDRIARDFYDLAHRTVSSEIRKFSWPGLASRAASSPGTSQR